jgi:hypothetical protein
VTKIIRNRGCCLTTLHFFSTPHGLFQVTYGVLAVLFGGAAAAAATLYAKNLLLCLATLCVGNTVDGYVSVEPVFISSSFFKTGGASEWSDPGMPLSSWWCCPCGCEGTVSEQEGSVLGKGFESE